MRVIALDLDGTIVDCKERQSLLAATLCRAAGFELNIETFWSAKRAGATTASAICEQGIDVSFAAELSKLWIEHVEREAWLCMDRLLPGVIDSLQNTRELGFRLHLVTARANERALSGQLRSLSIAQFFDHVEVVCPRKTTQEKSTYLATLAPVAFIGDSESDSAAANAACVRFIAVTSGQRSADYLHRHANIHPLDIKSNLQEAIQECIHE